MHTVSPGALYLRKLDPKAHRIAPLSGPGGTPVTLTAMSAREHSRAPRAPGIGDLRTDCAVLFDQKRVELSAAHFSPAYR